TALEIRFRVIFDDDLGSDQPVDHALCPSCYELLTHVPARYGGIGSDGLMQVPSVDCKITSQLASDRWRFYAKRGEHEVKSGN
ncbi:MAG: hypothetical protein ACREUU_13445, partial [Gammaproteobacteria bacterium]